MDFITPHLEGPAEEEVWMYSKKERSNLDFLLEVILLAFGQKRSSPQLLKLFNGQKQKENGTLQAYLYSLNELLKSATKAYPKAVPDPQKTLWDQFADNVGYAFLSKRTKEVH